MMACARQTIKQQTTVSTFPTIPHRCFSTVSLNPKWKILPTNIQIPFLGIILFGNFSSKSMFFGAGVLHVNPSEPKHVYV